MGNRQRSVERMRRDSLFVPKDLDDPIEPDPQAGIVGAARGTVNDVQLSEVYNREGP